MPQPRVSIRLGTDGKATVVKDFADIGDAGDAASARIAKAFQRDSALAEAAVEKLNKTAQRFASITPSAGGATNLINPITGASYAQADGAAQASARAIQQQMAAGEQAAQRLLASVDPLYAAQMRYNEAIAETNQLEAQGIQVEGGYDRIRAGLKAQLDAATVSLGNFRSSSGSARIAQMELMGAARGFTDAIAIGMPISRAMSIEMGRLTEAAALMGGGLGKIGEFMASGWGIAITLGSVALVPLITKLLDTGDAIDGVVDKEKKEEQQQALNDQAHQVFIHTLEGVEQAIREVEKAYDDYENRLKTSAQLQLDHASAALKDAEATRIAAQAALDKAAADQAGILSQAGLNGLGTNVGTPAGAALQAAVNASNAAQAQLDKSGADIAHLNGEIEKWQSIVTVEKASADTVEQIKRKYEGDGGLIEKARQHALAQHQVGDELERQVRLLKDREDAEIKAAQERDRNPGINAGGTAIFNDQIANFYDIANKYRGLSETRDRTTLQQLLGGVDPEKTAWCAAFINAILAMGGAKGTGSNAASSFLNYGKDDVHSPQRGDIVIVRSGGSPSGMHVGILDTIDSKGNVSLLGGNTGNRVGEATFSASQVLGVRRPPTPSEIFSDTVKNEQDWDDALAKLREAGDGEQKINLLHQDGANLIRQQVEGAGDLKDKIAAVLPALVAWNREYEQIQASQQELKDFTDRELDDLTDPSRWKNFRDLALQVLQDIEQEALRLSLLNPLKNWLNGENNPTISSLFKAIGSVAGAFLGGGGISSGPDISFDIGSLSSGAPDLGSLAAGLPGNAVGTQYFGGGYTWVGEFGKELVRLPRGSQITPATESRRIAAANDAPNITINMPVSIDATGADPAQLARTNAKLDRLNTEFPGRVIAAYAEAKQRNVIS